MREQTPVATAYNDFWPSQMPDNCSAVTPTQLVSVQSAGMFPVTTRSVIATGVFDFLSRGQKYPPSLAQGSLDQCEGL